MGRVCVLFCILSFVTIASAYHFGDVVTFEKRGQYNFILSEWSPIISKRCPRFMQDFTVELPGLDEKQYHSEKGFKIAFRVDNSRFMTPFLVVNDGSGTTLNFITFKFTYRGDDIVDIDWEADYEYDHNHGENKAVKPVMLHYTWEEYEEIDTAIGIVALLVPSLSTAMVLLFVSIAQVEALTSPSSGLPTTSSNSSSFSRDESTVTGESPSDTLAALGHGARPAPHFFSPAAPGSTAPAMPLTPNTPGTPTTPTTPHTPLAGSGPVLDSPFAHAYARPVRGEVENEGVGEEEAGGEEEQVVMMGEAAGAVLQQGVQHRSHTHEAHEEWSPNDRAKLD